MNNRIKELAMQVPRIKDLYDVGPVHRAAIEEFAELIVRECADCSYHMGKDSGPITADLIKIRIMSLIGVEE